MMENLQSKVETFDPHVRVIIAISAKLAAASLNPDLIAENLSDVADNQQTSTGVQKGKPGAGDQAAQWLALLCEHLEVDPASLPDTPTSSFIPVLAASMPEAQRFDVAFDLVLLSLGLATPLPTADPGTSPPLAYTALARAMIFRTAGNLGIRATMIEDAEKVIAQHLYFQLQAREEAVEANTVDGREEWDEVANARRTAAAASGRTWKWAATGAGFVLGGVAMGLTGGLAAPAVLPFLAGTLGLTALSGAGGAVLIGTLFGLGGGGLAGYKTNRRLKGLEELSFELIRTPDLPAIPSLTATIVCSGYLLRPVDSVEPWRSTYERSRVDYYALKADTATFLSSGKALEGWLRDSIVRVGGTEILKKTVLAGVALPLSVVSGATTLLDSDFTRCRDIAMKAGVLLAEILSKGIQGTGPCILIGYGPGATVVLSCLLELHRLGLPSLVFSATLISLPSSPSAASWARARSVVSHRLVNAWSDNDFLLAVHARVYTLAKDIAGLSGAHAKGVEDVDVSDIVGGHLELGGKVAEVLARVAEGEGARATAEGEGASE